jgi:hypothetical protein
VIIDEEFRKRCLSDVGFKRNSGHHFKKNPDTEGRRTVEARIDSAAGKHGIWMLLYQIQAAVGRCINCRIKYRQY